MCGVSHASIFDRRLATLPHGSLTAFKPQLGLSRKVEGVAGAQTGNTVCASLLQRPDPELGMRAYSLALAARTRAHEAPTSSQRYNTHALLAAVPSATTPIALVLAQVSASDAGGTKACSPGATRFVYVLFHLRHFSFRAKPEAPHLEPVNPPGPTLGLNAPPIHGDDEGVEGEGAARWGRRACRHGRRLHQAI